MPDPAQWLRIEELYYDALELPEAARAAYLAQACVSEDEVRREVESLLAARNAADGFLNAALPVFSAVETTQLSTQTLGAGECLQRYQVIGLLGKGGMGEVYLAEDTQLKRRVALKILPAKFTGETERVRRFEREARATSLLNHPHILTIHELGQTADGKHFLVTEFVAGQTLRQLLNERRVLPAREALHIVVQIAEAITVAHAAGIIHRDIKPENVMVRPDGHIKVLDFGLAKVTETQLDADSPGFSITGQVLGTVNYMSPEQARGQSVDARTDSFSLGVVLFELLTGQLPFVGETPSDRLAALLRAEPLPLTESPPELCATLQPILDRALAKDHNERLTVSELAHKLKQLTEDLTFQVWLADSGQMQLSSVSLEIAPQTGSVRTVILATVLAYKRHWQAAAIVLLALVGLFIAWQVRLRQAAPLAENVAPAPVKTLAVLPFKLHSSDATQQYLGLRVADALIAKLSNLRQLTVRPTNAVLRFQQDDIDVEKASQLLQVDAVLIGNILLSDDNKARVTVQLIKTPPANKTIQVLWSEVVNIVVDDLFEPQDKLAVQLMQRLELRFTGGEQRPLGKLYTANTASYQLYLQGHFFMSQRTTEGYWRALEYFAQALIEDARCAPAYLGEAMCWQLLIKNNAVPLSEGQAKSMQAVRQALRLDDRLGNGERLAALARTYALAGQQPEIEKLIAQIQYLADGFDNSFHLATIYARLGDKETALRELEHALRASRPLQVRHPRMTERWLLDSRLDPLRTDPRFRALLDKMKLAQ
jgi:eukaryotic-like serine/threonine-protein kinase